MTDFNDIQHIWNLQAAPAAPDSAAVINQAQKNAAAIRARHRGTIALLSLTVLGLTAYCTVYFQTMFSPFFVGLALMIGSLLLRVLLEYLSYRRFRRIDIHADFSTYTTRITSFYTKRRRINYVLTPLLLLLYMGGFLILLTVFRKVFAHGFYVYIVISGTLFFVFFAWLLTQQVKREMQLLDFLREVKEEG